MDPVPPIFPTGKSADHAALRDALRRAADLVADYLAGLGSRPIFPADPQPPEAEVLLPDEGEPLTQVLGESWSWAVENALHVGSPGYAGHMDSGVAVAAVVGDFLASALNQNLLAFELAPGATLLEQELVRVFCGLAGLPAGSGGSFVEGGTSANLTALLLARDASLLDPSRQGLAAAPDSPAILASADAHYSIAKSAAVLGIGSEQVLAVPTTGPCRRIDPEGLLPTYKAAVAKGHRPIALVATAGTTPAGAIDPISACADFASEFGLWLHVDAALGGALLFHPEKRGRLAGLERADSITLDPHKWLYAPKSAGVLLVRDAARLRPARYDAPYLDRMASDGKALKRSQGRKTIAGSRRFDALKVWMLLRHVGRRGLTRLVEDRLELANWFHQTLSEHPFFMPRHTPDLNVQVFAPRAPDQTAFVIQAHTDLERQGRLWASTTRLEGTPCHRVVLLNPSLGQQELLAILQGLEEAHRNRSKALPDLGERL